MTDRDGNLVQHYGYYPFGSERYENNQQAFSVSNRYTGQILDEDTGLYYYGARYGACPERSRRDPELGRFIQADPIVPGPDNSQAFNRYSYCLNNPLKFIDPTGHAPKEHRDLSRKATVLDFPDGALFGAGLTWVNITGEGLPTNGVSIPAIITMSPGFTGAGALSDAISGSTPGVGYGNNPFLVPIFNPEAAILSGAEMQSLQEAINRKAIGGEIDMEKARIMMEAEGMYDKTGSFILNPDFRSIDTFPGKDCDAWNQQLFDSLNGKNLKYWRFELLTGASRKTLFRFSLTSNVVLCEPTKLILLQGFKPDPFIIDIYPGHNPLSPRENIRIMTWGSFVKDRPYDYVGGCWFSPEYKHRSLNRVYGEKPEY